MDPITTAIVLALPRLAADIVRTAVKDAYEGLKAVILRKWGEASPLAGALAALEANPKSQGQAMVLAENLAATRATADDDVMQALALLVGELRKQGIGSESVAKINIGITGGTQGVVGSQNVSVGSMSVGVSGSRKNG